MYPFPPGYEEALRGGHIVDFRARLSGLEGTLQEGSDLVLSGNVTVDRGAKHRRSINLTLNPEMISKLSDILPYGNEIQIWRGIYLGDGTYSQPFLPGYWYQSLGVFRLSTNDLDDDGWPSTAVTAYDRSRAVSRAKFTSPYVIGAGSNYVTAITDLVRSRLPSLATSDVVAASTAEVTPLITLDPEMDPWEEAQKMGTAIGMEVFFDPEGRLNVQPEADAGADSPLWLYTEGSDTILLGTSRRISDDPGYNGVIMTAESTTLATPLRSEVWDTDPQSPTYYLGAYGSVPKFLSSPYVATQDQCDAAAAVELKRELGVTENVQFAVVPNVVHEAGDVVSINRELSQISGNYVIESFQIPIDVRGAMTVNTKEQRARV